MHQRPIVIFIVALLLTACATSYQPKGFTGGYTETRLAPDVARIFFYGNVYTTPEKVQDLALLRAADLSLEGGYPFFVVLDEANGSTEHVFTTQASSYTTGTLNSEGGQAFYSGYTTYNPGQTIIMYKPQSGILVQFLKEKPQAGFTFDAAFIENSMKTKYGIQ